MASEKTFTSKIGDAVDSTVAMMGLTGASAIGGGLFGGAIGMVNANSIAMGAHMVAGTGATGVSVLTGQGTSMVLAGAASGFGVGAAVAAGAFAAYAAYKAVSYYAKHDTLKGYVYDLMGIDDSPRQEHAGKPEIDREFAQITADKLSADRLSANLATKLEALKAKRVPEPAHSTPTLAKP